jgi:hypothetical protein
MISMTRIPPSDFKSRKSCDAQIDPANRFESTRIEKDVPQPSEAGAAQCKLFSSADAFGC